MSLKNNLFRNLLQSSWQLVTTEWRRDPRL